MNEIHEECGVFGIWSAEKKHIAHICAAGLTALQYRGQEAAGIAVNEDRNIRYHKAQGLVSEVFPADELERMGEGNIAVGHVRYATTGESSALNAQPMVVKHIKGQLALCHNGNLTNSSRLKKELELKGCIFHTTSDTEVISYIITRKRLQKPSIETALEAAMEEIKGAYSLVLMSPAKLMACRDPLGMRPLVYGVTSDGSVVFASESCALDAVGAKLVRDVEPGEIVVCDGEGIRSIRTHCRKQKPKLCIFEYIYFSRPDSVIEGVCVHDTRIKAGEFLAKRHPAKADVVIGVPDSGLDAALGFASESGIPYGIGLIKNKYIGRTFIAPEQSLRESLVRQKMGAIPSVLEGKSVVLVDDSIVRGTTSARIVKMIREAGAREVHMRISSPPFLNPCYYGTDVDSRENLIAVHHTNEEICGMIGADSLGFLSVEDARRLATGVRYRYGHKGCEGSGAEPDNGGCPGGGFRGGIDTEDPESFCAACFDGKYPVGD
ncbi:MAG: amidophosphoribosyltransferase [Lachnospiraceae bacterium]|nr:amidophosphoribosyltransferase [Lachnospiraceae bacterium]